MNIKMKNIMSITAARKNIFDIAEKVQKNGNHFLFTEGGQPRLVVMSAEEYENIMEDLQLASDPKFRARLRLTEEEFASGKYYTWDDIKKDLKKRKLSKK